MKTKTIRKKQVRNFSVGYSTLYAVICQFNGGEWGFADAWGKPYTSSKYLETVRMKREITKKAYKVWEPKSKRFAVPRSIVRRLQELAEEGKIHVDERDGHAFYSAEPKLPDARLAISKHMEELLSVYD